MRSNDLNKYAITHFIMHIASVLSAISAIPPLSICSTGTRSSLSLRFLHSTCGIFGYTLLGFYFFRLARESIAKLGRLGERKKAKM